MGRTAQDIYNKIREGNTEPVGAPDYATIMARQRRIKVLTANSKGRRQNGVEVKNAEAEREADGVTDKAAGTTDTAEQLADGNVPSNISTKSSPVARATEAIRAAEAGRAD